MGRLKEVSEGRWEGGRRKEQIRVAWDFAIRPSIFHYRACKKNKGLRYEMQVMWEVQRGVRRPFEGAEVCSRFKTSFARQAQVDRE